LLLALLPSRNATEAARINFTQPGFKISLPAAIFFMPLKPYFAENYHNSTDLLS
jgi:hypothetical protein